MDSLKSNIAANFAGSIWQALMVVVFIPFYIKFMGIESYGLIGIFATLQAILGLLDLGMSGTLTREMARLSVLQHKEQEIRNLVRTLETVYWSIAILAGITIALLAPIIANHWINAGEISSGTIEQALLLMGLVTVFQMPVGFYSGGLTGLQKQVLLNIINACMNTLRGAGAVLVLWLVYPTIQAFLLWQIGISIMNAFLLAVYFWRKLPRSENKAVFQKQLIKGVWRFTAGVSGISILAVVLTQLDKVILSKILSLEMFGYYMLASMVAMSLSRLFTPMFLGVYPRFTQLVSINDQIELKSLYHKSCQVMSVLILPVAIVVAFFSHEVILIWTQDPATAAKTYPMVSILICGTAINGLMYLPFALQLSHGWTRLSIFKTSIAVILIVPLIIYMTTRHGVIGAAIPWLVLNVGMFIFEIPVMHRRLLQTEKWRWYWQDVGLPLLAGVSFAGMGRIFLNSQASQITVVSYLLMVSSLTLGAVALMTPVTRAWIFGHLKKA